MADAASSPDFFDVARIRQLIELMSEHGLSEVNLRQGELRIQLRRGGEPVVFAPPAYAPPAPAAAPAVAAAPRPVAPAAPAEPAREENVAIIRSPMVGTFYASPDPDSPPFAKVGDMLGPDTIVCIVEAMKVFNQIPAEVSGKVVAVLVENGAPVEFGQPMFKINTRP